jgi:hypothetical protein
MQNIKNAPGIPKNQDFGPNAQIFHARAYPRRKLSMKSTHVYGGDTRSAVLQCGHRKSERKAGREILIAVAHAGHADLWSNIIIVTPQ